ncbi:MAG: hypothetical protein ACI9WV_000064 [Patiriisocius sp.]
MAILVFKQYFYLRHSSKIRKLFEILLNNY